MFVGIGETNDKGWIYMVATQVTDIPFMLSLLAKKAHVGDMEILLSLRI